MKRGREEEEEGDLMMHQRGSLLQTGLVVWDELKWGEDSKEGGEDITSSTSMSGGLFLPKQDRACWTPFLTHDF